MKRAIQTAGMCLGSILLASCSQPVHLNEYYKQ